MIFAFFTMVVVLMIGLRTHEIKIRHAILCVATAIAGIYIFRYFGWHLAGYVAVLVVIDIALILKIYKGDIRIQ